jgi:hypothetical protein
VFLAKYAGKEKIHSIFILLDKDDTCRRTFIEKPDKLTTSMYVCEYKGWKSDVVKRYNIYAAQSHILLDKNKHIVLKLLFTIQGIKVYSTTTTNTAKHRETKRKNAVSLRALFGVKNLHLFNHKNYSSFYPKF